MADAALSTIEALVSGGRFDKKPTWRSSRRSAVFLGSNGVAIMIDDFGGLLRCWEVYENDLNDCCCSDGWKSMLLYGF